MFAASADGNLLPPFVVCKTIGSTAVSGAYPMWKGGIFGSDYGMKV